MWFLISQICILYFTTFLSTRLYSMFSLYFQTPKRVHSNSQWRLPSNNVYSFLKESTNFQFVFLIVLYLLNWKTFTIVYVSLKRHTSCKQYISVATYLKYFQTIYIWLIQNNNLIFWGCHPFYPRTNMVTFEVESKTAQEFKVKLRSRVIQLV